MLCLLLLISGVGNPVLAAQVQHIPPGSAWRKMPMICSLLNRPRFMAPLHARNPNFSMDQFWWWGHNINPARGYTFPLKGWPKRLRPETLRTPPPRGTYRPGAFATSTAHRTCFGVGWPLAPGPHSLLPPECPRAFFERSDGVAISLLFFGAVCHLLQKRKGEQRGNLFGRVHHHVHRHLR